MSLLSQFNSFGFTIIIGSIYTKPDIVYAVLTTLFHPGFLKVVYGSLFQLLFKQFGIITVTIWRSAEQNLITHPVLE